MTGTAVTGAAGSDPSRSDPIGADRSRSDPEESDLREAIRELLSGGAPSRAELARILERFARFAHRTSSVEVDCLEPAEELTVRENWTDLRMRIQLLRGWAAVAGSDVVEAARVGRVVNAWAREHRDQHLVATSHCLLSTVFRGIGDHAEALTQAVHTVARTPADAEPWVRSAHLNALGVALAVSGSLIPGQRRFAEALAVAESCDDADQELSVLNNLAYVKVSAGDVDSARRFSARMRELSLARGVPLKSTHLDTLARIEMAAGRFDLAERLLEPVADHPTGVAHSDADSYVICLLTLAESQRALGATDRAERTLDRCAQAARERRLDRVAALELQERARLEADRGRYREAYQAHTRFHDAWERLQDQQREIRAGVTHARYEVEETRRDRDQFRELATRDPLTGLFNRRVLDERLGAAISAAAAGTPFSVALFDLDHFKRVNDTCSHEAGDRVLRQVAALARSAVPERASLVRMGGEEFLAILPGCGPDAAVAQAERVRVVVEGHDWSGVTGHLPVTVSIGITSCPAGGPVTVSELLSAADRHLYAAKRAGRNRVVGDDGTGSDPSPPSSRPDGAGPVRERRRYR